MRKIILFIAMSLDGYISDSNGNVDWLEEQNNDNENIDTYSGFIKNIDTIIMGWNTYHQIVTQLSPSEWPYTGINTYIITHNKESSSKEIHFTSVSPSELLKELKTTDGKNIWVCGGADIVQQLIKENLIDEYYISVIPILLGNGIPLFRKSPVKINLSLKEIRNNNGIAELFYSKNDEIVS